MTAEPSARSSFRHVHASAASRGAITTVVLVWLLAGCGATYPVKDPRPATPAGHATRAAHDGARVTRVPRPQALVTDETENRLLVVDLPNGRVARRVALPAGPEDLATVGNGAVVIVVSSRAGKVTILDRATLRRIKVFAGFDSPHIAAVSADGSHAYITDDARGTLTVIRLADMTMTSTVRVGVGAHHITSSPARHRLWIALGESASHIAILDTTDPDHPRLIGRFDPGFLAHDLSFTPDGREVWITSAAGPAVAAFDARNHRLLFRVPVGPPPQHLVLEGRYAYLTSGYGGTIERVDVASRRVVTRAPAPHGSFELDAADGYVATSSLLRGTLAVYNPHLKLLRVVQLAPATREVAISRP
jgi:DNA-binding beta-propeller fold protein YncE